MKSLESKTKEALELSYPFGLSFKSKVVKVST